MKATFLVAGVALAVALSGQAHAQQIRVIATNPQGSIYYASGSVIGKMMNEQLKMQVRVQPMGGSSNYIPLISRGEADFGIINVDDAASSFKGTGNFSRPNPGLRLTSIVFPLTLGIMVVNNSDIKTLQDLKGKRMPSGYNAQTTGRVLQRALLTVGGLSEKDIVGIPTQSLFSGVDLLAEGKVDAATISIGTGQGQRANVTLQSKGGVRFLNVPSTPEAVKAMNSVLPSFPLQIQPAPHAVGIVGPTTVMAYNCFFVTNDKMPEDVVYNVVKMLHSNKDELVKGAPVFRNFNPDRMVQEIGVPWHPGAVKFFKETGQWKPAG